MPNENGMEPSSPTAGSQPQPTGTRQQQGAGVGSVEGQGTGANQQPQGQEKKTHEAELMSRWQSEQAARSKADAEVERLRKQVQELEDAKGDAVKLAELKARHQTENVIAENNTLKVNIALQNAPLVQKAIAAGKIDPANFRTPEEVTGAEEVIKSMMEANMPTQQPNPTPPAEGNPPANQPQAPNPAPAPEPQPPQGVGAMSTAPQGEMSEEQEKQVDVQAAVKNKSFGGVVRKWILGEGR